MKIPCNTCMNDYDAILEWRKEGGAIPPITCKREHIRGCKGCHTIVPCVNANGLCDDCWSKQERKVRPL